MLFVVGIEDDRVDRCYRKAKSEIPLASGSTLRGIERENVILSGNLICEQGDEMRLCHPFADVKCSLKSVIYELKITSSLTYFHSQWSKLIFFRLAARLENDK